MTDQLEKGGGGGIWGDLRCVCGGACVKWNRPASEFAEEKQPIPGGLNKKMGRGGPEMSAGGLLQSVPAEQRSYSDW